MGLFYYPKWPHRPFLVQMRSDILSVELKMIALISCSPTFLSFRATWG
jgi:hypothetical protein